MVKNSEGYIDRSIADCWLPVSGSVTGTCLTDVAAYRRADMTFL